jgi:hypothetical protein
MAALLAALLAECTTVLKQLVQYGFDWRSVRETAERIYEDFTKRGFVISPHSRSHQVNAVGAALTLPSVPTVYSFACPDPSRSLTCPRIGASAAFNGDGDSV